MMVISAWSRYFVELLSRLVCQLTISFHTFLGMTLHIVRSMKKYEDFPSMAVFQFTLRKFVIQTWLCNCPKYLCLFHVVFECIPGFRDQGKMLVLPNQLLYWVLSTSDHCFVSFQLIWCHPHTQIRITLFDGVRISIPNWQLSANRISIRLSRIAFHITVLPEDDPYKFRSRGTTGSSILDHDFCHLCRCRRIQMSGH